MHTRIIRTRSTQPVQIYLLTQSAFNSFHCSAFHKNYKNLPKYFTLIQSIFVVFINNGLPARHDTSCLQSIRDARILKFTTRLNERRAERRP